MNKFDLTLDDVQNSRFNNIYNKTIKQMVKLTQFSHLEVKSILMVFHKFVLQNGPRAKYITNKQFVEIFEVIFGIYDLHIIHRINYQLSSNIKLGVGPKAWVKLFSIFMTKKLEPKMKFIFDTYNISGLDVLNRQSIMRAVHHFFEGNDEDEVNELRSDMLEYIFKKFDVDRDGVISFEDYSTVVKKDPLTLEFLGPCLPTMGRMSTTIYCMNIISRINKAEFDINKRYH